MDWISAHIPPWVFIAIIAHLAVLGSVAYLILLERKVASWVQDRIGPNRVGLGFGIIPKLKDMHMFGLGQPLADGLKFILKEDYRPKNVDKILFTLAPGVMITVVIISIATLPWGGWHQTSRTVHVYGAANPTLRAQEQAANEIPGNAEFVGEPLLINGGADAIVTYKYPFQIANLNIGVLFILAALSLAVYGVVIGGWASNNKYSFLGGLRATANMISYEIPLGLAVLCVVATFGTLDLAVITEKQAHYWLGFIPAWNCFSQPLAFLMFLVCIHAEANRAPFDTAEAEQELVGGYHTEYSAMRFALFFLAEYAGMITTSAVCVALFFGGWHLPWIEWLIPALRGDAAGGHPEVTTSLIACIVRSLIFFGKTMGIIFIFMWVRWSLPRFRFDQIMMLAWRALIPMSLLLLLATVIAGYLGGYSPDGFVTGRLAIALLIANIATLAITMIGSTLVPPAPETNRRMHVAESRYARTPLPGGAVAST
ncbi:MAG TPA: complex I subunit 1 family protein [Tepidisphaeraceae bacterium]|nr:complex I subunit 1 family protein [Tepidisphaeraceae bacterium]